MPQAPDVFDHFDADVLDKVGIVERVNAARKDKILPDQDAIAVAKIVKALILVKAAAPHAQHVLVRLGCRTDQVLQGSLGQARGEGIGRNPVGAFGKEGLAVDHKSERAPPFVWLLPQLNRAQTQLVGLFIQGWVTGSPQTGSVAPEHDRAVDPPNRSATKAADFRFPARGRCRLRTPTQR